MCIIACLWRGSSSVYGVVNEATGKSFLQEFIELRTDSEATMLRAELTGVSDKLRDHPDHPMSVDDAFEHSKYHFSAINERLRQACRVGRLDSTFARLSDTSSTSRFNLSDSRAKARVGYFYRLYGVLFGSEAVIVTGGALKVVRTMQEDAELTTQLRHIEQLQMKINKERLTINQLLSHEYFQL